MDQFNPKDGEKAKDGVKQQIWLEVGERGVNAFYVRDLHNSNYKFLKNNQLSQRG